MADDLDRLQGTWHIVSLETDGRKMAPATFGASTIALKGKKFVTASMGAEYEGTIELDAAKRPKQFTLKFTKGPEKGQASLGLYKLSGDTWTICLTTGEASRPKKFRTTAGSGLALQTLKRGQADAAQPTRPRSSRMAATASPPATTASAPTAPDNELAGEWAMVSYINDGRPLDDSFVKFCRRVTRGNETTVFAADRVMMSARFTLDASASPPRIDYFSGKNTRGKPSQLGIYEIRGDRLAICMAPKGRPRPTTLTSQAGDGRTLTVWNLIKR